MNVMIIIILYDDEKDTKIERGSHEKGTCHNKWQDLHNFHKAVVTCCAGT